MLTDKNQKGSLMKTQKIRTKLMSLLLAAIMVLSLLTGPAKAAYGRELRPF